MARILIKNPTCGGVRCVQHSYVPFLSEWICTGEYVSLNTLARVGHGASAILQDL